MVILHLALDKIYGFDHFEIDFTYPKKVVNSIIEEEHLAGRERFRYKKLVVLMGSNATGKTTLGKAIMKIFSFINTGNPAYLYEMASGEGASFSVDFVNEGYTLHRLSAKLGMDESDLSVRYESAEIGRMDSYEICVRKLEDRTAEAARTPTGLRKLTGKTDHRLSYPEIEGSLRLAGIRKRLLLKTFRAVIGTLDPTLMDVSVSNDLKDTFIIRRKGKEIIIQEGKLLNSEALSSGTAEGINVAVFLASMMSKEPCFYYCDEHFSYIQSDIEKRIFGIMLGQIGTNSQLIFTTHNTDMLDLNLPKHSYMFLRKRKEDGSYRITSISASEFLKKNTDSIRNAVENDIFGSVPDESLLDELEMGWLDE